jgi:hypothetical protein
LIIDPRTIVLAVTASLVGAACGSRATGAAGVASDIAAACASSRMVECNKMETCEGGWATTIYGSVDTCVARLTVACERFAMSPGSGVTAAELSTCGANQQAQSCDEWFGIRTPGCGYSGLKVDREPCRFGSQCINGFCNQYLYRTQRNVCGVCGVAPQLGDRCDSSCGGDGSLACEYSNPSDSRGTCVASGGAGDTCGATAPCLPGLLCALPTAGATSGQCAPAEGNVGDPCDDTVGPFCDYRRRIYCNDQLGTCALAQDVEPGGACGVLADGSTGQCRGGICLGSSAGVPGTCIAYLPDGSPCTFGPGTQSSCTPPAICDTGICRISGGELCQ